MTGVCSKYIIDKTVFFNPVYTCVIYCVFMCLYSASENIRNLIGRSLHFIAKHYSLTP